MEAATFFEVGGEIVESYVEEQGYLGMSPINDPIVHYAVSMGVEKQYRESRTAKVIQGYGRMRRARWAASTAIGLAAADGPLPFGDAAALVFLVLYAGYETIGGTRDVLGY